MHRLTRIWKYQRARFERNLHEVWQNFTAHWRQRSYWDGYHAELDGLPHRGHGWTAKRALASLAHIEATQHYAEHKPCGYRRLTAKVRKHYCVTCGKKPRRGWVALAPDEVDR
ncbi:hypothetical protein [Rhizocola hellebori]|nr:hypothetical protein [Rhizocola hellebori]